MTKTTAKSKYKFGAAPKDFPKTVDIVLLNGEVSEIKFNFKYRTRSEFADLIDQNIAEAKERAEASEKDEKKASEITIASMYAQMDQIGVDFIMKIADGWDLDEPFSAAALARLENENPGSMTEIAAVYRASVAEPRTKNS